MQEGSYKLYTALKWWTSTNIWEICATMHCIDLWPLKVKNEISVSPCHHSNLWWSPYHRSNLWWRRGSHLPLVIVLLICSSKIFLKALMFHLRAGWFAVEEKWKWKMELEMHFLCKTHLLFLYLFCCNFAAKLRNAAAFFCNFAAMLYLAAFVWKIAAKLNWKGSGSHVGNALSNSVCLLLYPTKQPLN